MTALAGERWAVICGSCPGMANEWAQKSARGRRWWTGAAFMSLERRRQFVAIGVLVQAHERTGRDPGEDEPGRILRQRSHGRVHEPLAEDI